MIMTVIMWFVTDLGVDGSDDNNGVCDRLLVLVIMIIGFVTDFGVGDNNNDNGVCADFGADNYDAKGFFDCC